MNTRLTLPACRNHITQKVKVAGQRTLYVSVHDDARPSEIFLRIKGRDCSSELIGLYDVIARLALRCRPAAIPGERMCEEALPVT